MNAAPSITELLLQTGLFAHLGANDVSTLIAKSERKVYPAGTVIVREGDPADAMYIVLEGHVQVFAQGRSGEVALARIGPANFFGETALLPQSAGRRTASVRALTEVVLLCVQRDQFLTVLAGDAKLRDRLADMSEQYRRQRVALQSQLFTALGSASGLGLGEALSFKAGEVVFSEGDPADRVFVIVEGTAGVYAGGHERPSLLVRLGAGQCFGELGLIERKPRSATVIAETELHLFALGGEEFLAEFERNPELRAYMRTLKSVYRLGGIGVVTQFDDRFLDRDCLTTHYRIEDGRQFSVSRVVGDEIYHLERLDPGAPAAEHTLKYDGPDGTREIRLSADRRIVGMTVTGFWDDLSSVHMAAVDGLPFQPTAFDQFPGTGRAQLPVFEDRAGADAMLCRCIRVTHDDAQRAVQSGCHDLESLQRRTGCGTVCGTCVPAVLETLGTQAWTAARIAEETPLAREVRAYRLRPTDGTAQPARPGQFVVVEACIEGLWVRRSYTLTSAESPDGCYEIAVKREPHGLFGGWLFDGHGSDALIRVSPPAGTTVWEGGSQPVVCFVAGIGVTPAIAILRAVLDRGESAPPIHIDYTARTAEDFAFRETIEAAERANENVTARFRESSAEGRIKRADVAALVAANADAAFFLCGPHAYLEDVRGMLRAEGVPADRIHVEVFTHAGDVPETSGNVAASRARAREIRGVRANGNGRTSTLSQHLRELRANGVDTTTFWRDVDLSRGLAPRPQGSLIRTTEEHVEALYPLTTYLPMPKSADQPIVLITAEEEGLRFARQMMARVHAAQPGTTPRNVWLFHRSSEPSDAAELFFLQTDVTQGRWNLHARLSFADRTIGRGALRLASRDGAPVQTVAGLFAPHEFQLWDLMQPRIERGQGALFHVFGPAGFTTETVDALLDGIRHQNPHMVLSTAAPGAVNAAEECFYRMVAADRFGFRLPTSDRGSAKSVNGPGFYWSEISRHSDLQSGVWTVISGKVYDLTRYLYLHPGGDAIIRDKGGRDATFDFANVGHAVPAIEGMLREFLLGPVREPSFAMAEGTDAYQAWRGFADFSVETRNVLRLQLNLETAGKDRGRNPAIEFGIIGMRLFNTHVPTFWDSLRALAESVGSHLELGAAERELLERLFNDPRIAERHAQLQAIWRKIDPRVLEPYVPFVRGEFGRFAYEVVTRAIAVLAELEALAEQGERDRARLAAIHVTGISGLAAAGHRLLETLIDGIRERAGEEMFAQLLVEELGTDQPSTVGNLPEVHVHGYPPPDVAARLRPAALPDYEFPDGVAPSLALLRRLSDAPLDRVNGVVSEKYGFLEPPGVDVPETHAEWRDLARQLPELMKTGRLRETLQQMPELSAEPDALPDECLTTAATLLGIMANGYWHCYVIHEPLPRALELPWRRVNERLHRPGPSLTLHDYTFNNWQTSAPNEPLYRMRPEHFSVRHPQFASACERWFIGSLAMSHAHTIPLVSLVPRAQQAVVDRDADALALALEGILDTLTDCQDALMLVDPRPFSDTYVDPMLWAQSVAMSSVQVVPGTAEATSIAGPVFHLMDVALGRRKYESIFGVDNITLRKLWLPRNQLAFFEAVGQVSIRAYVESLANDRPDVVALYNDVVNTYAGPRGFLQAHRLKAFGYTEATVKVGRVKNSAASGRRDQDWRNLSWVKTSQKLAEARLERSDTSVGQTHAASHYARQRAAGGGHGSASAKLLVSPVDDVLVLMGATGDEEVEVTDPRWRAVSTGANAPRMRLRELLEAADLDHWQGEQSHAPAMA